MMRILSEMLMSMWMAVAITGCGQINGNDSSDILGNSSSAGGNTTKAIAAAKNLFQQYVANDRRYCGSRDLDCHDDKSKVYADLNYAMYELGTPALPYYIEEFEKDGQTLQNRWMLATLLGNIGDEAAVPALSTHIESDNSWLKIQVSGGLAMIGKPSEQALVTKFDEVREHTYRYIISALGRIRSDKAVDRLVEIAEDQESVFWNDSITVDTRQEAIRALGRIGDRRALTALQQLGRNIEENENLAPLARHSVKMINAFASGQEPYKVRDKSEYQLVWHSSADGSYDPRSKSWIKKPKDPWAFPRPWDKDYQ